MIRFLIGVLVGLALAAAMLMAGARSTVKPVSTSYPLDEVEYGSPQEIESMHRWSSACERMARDANRKRAGYPKSICIST